MDPWVDRLLHETGMAIVAALVWEVTHTTNILSGGWAPASARDEWRSAANGRGVFWYDQPYDFSG